MFAVSAVCGKVVRVLVGVTVTVIVVVENSVVVEVTSSLESVETPEKNVVVAVPVIVYIVPLRLMNVVVSTTSLPSRETVAVVSVMVVPGATVVIAGPSGLVGAYMPPPVIVNVVPGKVMVVSADTPVTPAAAPTRSTFVGDVGGPVTEKKAPGML